MRCCHCITSTYEHFRCRVNISNANHDIVNGNVFCQRIKKRKEMKKCFKGRCLLRNCSRFCQSTEEWSTAFCCIDALFQVLCNLAGLMFLDLLPTFQSNPILLTFLSRAGVLYVSFWEQRFFYV